MSSSHFTSYLDNIGQVPLLDFARECALGTIIQAARQRTSAAKKRAAAAKKRALQAEQRVVKAAAQGVGLRAMTIDREARIKARDEELRKADEATYLVDDHEAGEAIKELVGTNLRLVVKYANHYRNSHLDIEELTFEGNRGLITAAERFDPAKGCRFSTYATWWIQQSIRMAVNSGHIIHIPVRRAAQIAKIQAAASFDPELDEQDFERLTMETNIEEKDIRKLLKNRTQMLPLDAPAPDGEGNSSLQAIIPSGESSADTHVITAEQQHMLQNSLATLPEKTRMVVSRRFGLNDTRPQTLEEIAQDMNVTRECIRKIQRDGIRLLQTQMKGIGYTIQADAVIEKRSTKSKSKLQSDVASVPTADRKAKRLPLESPRVKKPRKTVEEAMEHLALRVSSTPDVGYGTLKTPLTYRRIIFEIMSQATGPITVKEACTAAQPLVESMNAKGKTPMASFRSKFYVAAKRGELLRIDKKFVLRPADHVAEESLISEVQSATQNTPEITAINLTTPTTADNGIEINHMNENDNTTTSVAAPIITESVTAVAPTTGQAASVPDAKLTYRGIIFQVLRAATAPLTMLELSAAATPLIERMAAKGKTPMASFKAKVYVAAKNGEVLRIDGKFAMPPEAPVAQAAAPEILAAEAPAAPATPATIEVPATPAPVAQAA
jgi:RNA polymerase nonessential primary-like sigma factor